MNFLVKKLLSLVALGCLTSPAMAFYYGTPLKIQVENASGHDLKISPYKEKGDVSSARANIFDITHFDGSRDFDPEKDKMTNDGNYVNLGNLNSTFDNMVLENGKTWESPEQIIYSNYDHYWYYTRIKLKIPAEAGKEDRFCDIRLPMTVNQDRGYDGILVREPSKDEKEYSYFETENNERNKGNCQLSLSARTIIQKKWNASVSGGGYYKDEPVTSKLLGAVKIKILPDDKPYQRATVDQCEKTVEVNDLAKIKPVCNGGTLKITFPNHKPIFGMEFSFEKASYDTETQLNYSIIESDGRGLVGFPTWDKINQHNKNNTCHHAEKLRDAATKTTITGGSIKEYVRITYPETREFTNECKVSIPGIINAGDGSYITLRNDGPGVMLLHVKAKLSP